jgi:hypothetical protein
MALGIGANASIFSAIYALLYQTPPSDPLTIGSAATLLLATATAACGAPALRISATNVARFLSR